MHLFNSIWKKKSGTLQPAREKGEGARYADNKVVHKSGEKAKKKSNRPIF